MGSLSGGGGGRGGALLDRALAVERAAAMLRFRIAAALLWAAGVYTTHAFLSGLLMYYSSRDVWIAAIITQLVLTVAESEFWGGGRSPVATGAVVIDTAINAAGIYPILTHLDATNVWLLVRDLTGIPALGAWGTLAVAIALGYIIAYAPERMWR